MPSRFTMLMQVTTDPQNRGDASPHTGGWSESFWAANVLEAGNPALVTLCRKRANLLPAPASVVGYRIASYTIAGNKVIPTGSSTAKLQIPGSILRNTDVPQMALELSGQALNGPNSTRFSLRCIPDSQVDRGEYQPDPLFKGLLTQYRNELIQQFWKFMGRDLTKPAIRVNAIAGNVVTLGGPWGGVVGTDFVRFNRVYDDLGLPITGAYLVSAANGNAITLAGFDDRTLTKQSGTVRIDAITLQSFATIEPARIVVRKIGRPFESYRGRQSKR